MLKAILIGVAAAVLLAYGSTALHEQLAAPARVAMWPNIVSPLILTIVALLPGFVAGWLAGRRGILAGFLAALIGNIVYSAVFGTFWDVAVEGGAAGIVSTLLWLCFMALSWALSGAAAGGTAQLLRMRPESSR